MKLTRTKALLESLKSIPDYRVDTGKIEYPLHEVLFMTLFALIKGNTTFKDIFSWMIYNKDNAILKEIFDKEEITIPSKSTYHRLLINTDNNALEKVFREFFFPFIAQENIAIDGKWLRGSDVNGQYTQERHKAILNILDKDIKIVFAHKFLDKNKSSEITALKEVLNDNIFSNEGQIFSFDALLTQSEILNTIDEQGNRYIAKLKDNQKHLKEKAIKTIEEFNQPTDRVDDEDSYLTENNKRVSRKVEVFQNKSADLVMYHENFQNIQSLIKVTKTLTNAQTGEVTISTQYLMANFKTTAKEFLQKILQHWRVETYHYHLDMLTEEDDHIAYKEPFSIAILRSFTVNLYQLFLNENKDKKVLLTGKTTMADIKRNALYRDDFSVQLIESNYID
ncbi:ISAs1 family transposase [Sulfurimonas sediminis]|uniref:ISAs1 family transposase n=1 Tax=Sulfurimonas sediminis TaxID=2590020 RepID=A0A7M1B023_9BACT|nr:ISAs1 family transposase [Sulfurimonas sediminis]QOP42886.1 ISAs1 family transposase [Sulfurimonas sediminis]QOP43088.1 ISAs1 family transposase [Sulfurimonas sediminis]QOP43248.1 ISAs1 family transposase [Sulfurimonas sediminis]QOP43750.1 ISAs1 family transposase [Sulfurimonas sediminis]QOP43878.1 ISAs1 family transposase [Sulfurimonas sediminis]